MKKVPTAAVIPGVCERLGGGRNIRTKSVQRCFDPLQNGGKRSQHASKLLIEDNEFAITRNFFKSLNIPIGSDSRVQLLSLKAVRLLKACRYDTSDIHVVMAAASVYMDTVRPRIKVDVSIERSWSGVHCTFLLPQDYCSLGEANQALLLLLKVHNYSLMIQESDVFERLCTIAPNAETKHMETLEVPSDIIIN